MNAGRAVGLVLGAVADGAIGDPRRRRRLAPGVLVLGVVLDRAAGERAVVRVAATALGTWAVLGSARLAAEGAELARDLETGDLDSARAKLATLDRDCTENLDVVGLSRASVETIAETTSDEVVAPLLWGAVAGVPGQLASRAVTELRDATGRHAERRSELAWLAWLAARCHELVNLVPTRVASALTVTGAPVVGGSAAGAWRAWRRDTVFHPEPNAGRVEAAFAGALEVRLGGPTGSPRGLVELPVLGDGRNPDAGHVTRAAELSRVVGWLAGGTSAVLALLTGVRNRKNRS